jgi:hypothetical protein
MPTTALRPESKPDRDDVKAFFHAAAQDFRPARRGPPSPWMRGTAGALAGTLPAARRGGLKRLIPRGFSRLGTAHREAPT